MGATQFTHETDRALAAGVLSWESLAAKHQRIPAAVHPPDCLTAASRSAAGDGPASIDITIAREKNESSPVELPVVPQLEKSITFSI